MHSYTRPVNFDQLLLLQNEAHFLPFSTTSLQVNLTTCTSLLYALFRMPADYNLIQLAIYKKKYVHKDNQLFRGITQPKADLPAEDGSICTEKI